MTPNQFARYLFEQYPAYRLDHLSAAECTHGIIIPELRSMIDKSSNLFRMKELGRSTENRSIHLFGAGSGERTVLLWSQMHGDESTATLALMDIVGFLSANAAKEKWIASMFEEITVYCIPMLNPDGAERRQRHTAANIDMNRDARTLATPEAQLLRAAQRDLSPMFGFNLHDQGLSSAGATNKVTALALLAPALDVQRSTPRVRLRAVRVGALIAHSLEQFVPGHLATYDDSFEPRAFGDSMQAWGTSTILIESGQWPGDPGKQFIRKLNFVAILAALRGIANGSYQEIDLDAYHSLPQNGKMLYDVIIRGVHIEHENWAHAEDIGLLAVPGKEGVVVVKEIGDLKDFGALETLEGSSRSLQASELRLEKEIPLKELLDRLQIYYSG